MSCGAMDVFTIWALLEEIKVSRLQSTIVARSLAYAENDVPDPFSLLGGTEAHAFLWERGVMRDLGTLGGPDSWGFYVNEKGQVAGFSFTSDLSVRPFLWNKGENVGPGQLRRNVWFC